MKHDDLLASLTSEGFRWERFREYFPFGDVALGERNYQRLVSAALESLVGTDQRELLLALLDAQAAVFLEQVWVQNEQRTRLGETGPLPVDGHFASAWLQINSNFRDQYGLPPKDVRIAMLNLQLPETLADRMVRPVAVAEPGGS